MTTHSAVYEALSSRDQASAGLRPSLVWNDRQAAVDYATANALTDPIPYPLVPPSGSFQLPVSRIEWRADGFDAIATIMSRQEIFLFNGAVVDSGATVIQSNQAETGRVSPRLQLAYAGGAKTAMDAVDADLGPTTYSIDYRYEEEVYQGLAHFMEFEEQPPNTDADGSLATRALLQTLQSSGSRYQIGVDASANPVYVQGCGFAGLAPEGAIYLRPEDYGGSDPGQVPSSVLNNTAAILRYHPSVFFRAGRANYVRSLTRGFIDGTAINAGASNNAIGMLVVDNPITESNWLVIVDGQPQIVALQHPAGSDYRRPRDIYQNVWLPIINGNATAGSATAFGSPKATNGGAVGNRWAYADYFRCLPLPGTYQVQDDSGPA